MIDGRWPGTVEGRERSVTYYPALPGRATHLMSGPHLWPLCGQVGGALRTEDPAKVDCRKCRRLMRKRKAPSIEGAV